MAVVVRRFAWVWTIVGFGVGLLLGYDWSGQGVRFEPTVVTIATLAGVFVSVIVSVWPEVRQPPLVPCPSCGRPRHPDAVLCPHCGAAK
ncbi:MAG: hypothetical protein A3K66_05110 [Euryarchaeota archaeon RBG_16_67_27]|nr:MAG: hypothetical protein A3K66_05110 [Euryarchaeota archaeon RBG_16_67_27]